MDEGGAIGTMFLIACIIFMLIGACTQNLRIEKKARMCNEGHKPSCEYFEVILKVKL